MQKSKTVLITGGAVRIGREIVLSFADKGWDVVIHYNNSAKPAEKLAAEITKKNCKAYTVKADLRDAKAVSAIIPSLAKQDIKLDCLINNAALFEKDSLVDITPASWQNHMNINLFAPLQLIRDFSVQYKGGQGNVINITDGMAGWSISPAFLSYSLSKMGLAEATKLLARELAPKIRINAVAPGPTLEGKQDKPDTFIKLKKLVPLGTISSPQQVCDAVHYLLNAKSVTGQVISLAGGL